jgi:hypothetical protein
LQLSPIRLQFAVPNVPRTAGFLLTSPVVARLYFDGARISRRNQCLQAGKEKAMSKAKFAAFVAALILSVSAAASAQSAQAALKAPPHMSKAQRVTWCRNHPNAVADCKEVRGDTHAIKADRKIVRGDRKEVKADIKAGNKSAAKADVKDLKSDRKELREDKKERRQDVRDARKDARRK